MDIDLDGYPDERNCPMRKRYYVPGAAQANYEGTLRNSRAGVRLDGGTLRRIDAAVSAALPKG